MLDEGADVNLARQLDGCTPLHLCAQFGSTGMLSTLLTAKANIKGEMVKGMSEAVLPPPGRFAR